VTVRAVAVWAVVCGAVIAQETPPDPSRDVRQACENPRYGVRISAAKKVVAAGDAAVPAIVAYAREKGRNKLPLTLVDAIAASSNRGEATIGLLREWAQDDDFFWRPIATRGLADRALPELADWFRGRLQDPSHLMRIQAGRGLLRLSPNDDAVRVAVRGLLADADPRVHVPVAIALLEAGDEAGLALLRDATTWTDEFLGDPWGARDAQTARMALAKLRPDAVAKPAAGAADAVAAGGPTFTGGIEVRSCKHGDWFARWTEDGRVAFGLRGALQAHSPALAKVLATPPPAQEAVIGDVVCDYVQSVDFARKHRQKCAPGAVPEDLAKRLSAIADALTADGHTAEAEALRVRLK
jgi:hypothetical protein